jgi:hypothetical protein
MFSILRFQALSLWNYHRSLCACAVLVILSAAVSVVALGTAAEVSQAQSKVLAELIASKKAQGKRRALDAPPRMEVSATSLPKFSNHEFTAQFHETAQ